MLNKLLEKGTKENKIVKGIVCIALCLFVLTFIHEAFLGGLFFGFMDFPCIILKDENGCLKASYNVSPEKLANANLAIYLSTHEAGYAGGGCFAETLKHGESRAYFGHSFRASGENVIIDEKVVLRKGERWSSTGTPKFFSLLTVVVPEISVVNNGIVTCIKNKDGSITNLEPFVLATGSAGTFFETNIPGVATFFVLLLILISMLVYEHKHKSKR